MKETLICPYCLKMTQKSMQCEQCNGKLIYNQDSFPISVKYVDLDWIPSRKYKEKIHQIVDAFERDPKAKESLIQFVMDENNFPLNELITIQEFRVFKNFEQYPAIQVWCRRGKVIFGEVDNITKRFGIFLHMTGPPMPSSPIKKWLDSYKFFRNEHQNKLGKIIGELVVSQHESKIWLNYIFNQNRFSSSNSFLLSIGNFQILLDVGFQTNDEQDLSVFEGIKHLDPSKIKLVILSHVHKDHTRGLLDLYEKGNCKAPILCTQTTFELYLMKHPQVKSILQQYRKDIFNNPDDEKLSFLERIDLLHYKMLENLNKLADSSKLFNYIKFISYHDVIQTKEGLKINFYQAGHLPGALMTELIITNYSENDNFRIIYTGDFSLSDFEPIPSARDSIKKIKAEPDVIICDSTAGDLHFQKEDATKALLYSQIYQTMIMNEKRDEKSSVLVLSDFNPGIVIPLFIFHEMAAESGKIRPPFYFTSRIWDLLCVFRDSPEDLSKELQKKINKRNDPFHSIMIRKLGKEWPELGGTGLGEAINEGSIICLLLSDLRTSLSEETFYAFEKFLTNPNNLLVLSGKMRNNIAQDLISGRGKIRIKVAKGGANDKDGISRFINVNCNILNMQKPLPHLFHFHPDYDQLMEFFDYLMPQTIIFFHSSPKTTIKIRNELSKRIYCLDHEHIHKFNSGIPLKKRNNLYALNKIDSILSLKRGMIVYGMVSKIIKSAAFIDIGVERNGYLHIGEIANEYIDNIHDYISENKIYKFRVIDINHNDLKFSLSKKL